MTELANIQRWLTSIIVKPGTLNDKILLADEHYGVNNEVIIRSSIRQTSEQKIGIYARGYILRLMECMEAEYPVVCNLLGEELFHTFVKAYLLKLPSTSPDLYDLGYQFPAFLKASQPQNIDSEQSRQFDLPVDLAILERALAEVARVKGLESNATGSHAENELLYLFDNTNIKASPSLKLLKLNWPLADYVKAVYQKQETVMPKKQISFLAVSRLNYRVNFQEVETWQWHFLRNLQASDNYMEAVTNTAEEIKIGKDILMADLLLWIPVALNFGYIYKND
jgi:hypothetical protein